MIRVLQEEPESEEYHCPLVSDDFAILELEECKLNIEFMKDPQGGKSHRRESFVDSVTHWLSLG